MKENSYFQFEFVIKHKPLSMLTVPNKCFFMIASGKLGSCLVSRLPVKTSTDDPIDPSEPPATIMQDKFAEIKNP